MLVSISGKASIDMLDKVTNSFIVSIYILPQIIPLLIFKSLNISGVIESKKYPIITQKNSLISLPENYSTDIEKEQELINLIINH